MTLCAYCNGTGGHERFSLTGEGTAAYMAREKTACKVCGGTGRTPDPKDAHITALRRAVGVLAKDRVHGVPDMIGADVLADPIAGPAVREMMKGT